MQYLGIPATLHFLSNSVLLQSKDSHCGHGNMLSLLFGTFTAWFVPVIKHDKSLVLNKHMLDVETLQYLWLSLVLQWSFFPVGRGDGDVTSIHLSR